MIRRKKKDWELKDLILKSLSPYYDKGEGAMLYKVVLEYLDLNKAKTEDEDNLRATFEEMEDDGVLSFKLKQIPGEREFSNKLGFYYVKQTTKGRRFIRRGGYTKQKKDAERERNKMTRNQKIILLISVVSIIMSIVTFLGQIGLVPLTSHQ